MPAVSSTGVHATRMSRAELRLASASFPSTNPADDEAPRAQSVERLVRLLAAHAPYDGVFDLRVPGLFAVRRSRPAREMERDEHGEG